MSSRALLLAALVGVGTRMAGAQAAAPPTVEPELRVDAIFGHEPAVQLGAGAQFALGYYVRLGVDGAVGVRTGAQSDSRLDGRVDVLTRFLLDPFRQSAYGLSVGGGLSVRAEPGDRARPYLLVAAELEGRRVQAGFSPALQVGLGGGVRVGMVLRRGRAGAR